MPKLQAVDVWFMSSSPKAARAPHFIGFHVSQTQSPRGGHSSPKSIESCGVKSFALLDLTDVVAWDPQGTAARDSVKGPASLRYRASNGDASTFDWSEVPEGVLPYEAGQGIPVRKSLRTRCRSEASL